MLLPSQIDPDEFDNVYRLTSQAWMAAIQEVCDAHSIPFVKGSAFTDGSNLVAAVSDNTIVKIFPPFHRHQWESEARVLAHLAQHSVAIPIPKLLASGTRLDGWPYVVISKLPGVTLESVWPTLTIQEKARLLLDVGAMMKTVHAVPVGELSNLEPQWDPFIQAQKGGAVARHARLGLPVHLLAEVDPFVTNLFPLLRKETPVILTGEYTPFNLLVDGGPGDWRLSGMIDFGDAMVGPREYDFLGPLLFLAEGQTELRSEFFKGYANPQVEWDSAQKKRLLLLAILHRYSNFKFQIRIPDWEKNAPSLAELERLLFP